MNSQQFRVVGANGQVSIGKKFAGKLVAVNENDKGEVVIKPGEFIPDNEKWLYRDGNLEKIGAALEWARKTPSQDNFDEWLEKLSADDDQNTTRSE